MDGNVIVKKKFYKRRGDVQVGDVVIPNCNYDVNWIGSFDEFYVSVISYIRVHNPNYFVNCDILISRHSNYNVFSIIKYKSYKRIFPDEDCCYYWFLTEVINDELRKIIISKIFEEWEYIKKDSSTGDDEDTFAKKYQSVKQIISATQQYYVQIVGYHIDNIITYTLENLPHFVDIYTFAKDMIIYPYKQEDMYYIKNTKKSTRFLQQHHPLFMSVQTIYSTPPSIIIPDSSAPSLLPQPSAPPL